ncbi:glutamate/aspartate ABC transporter substrate-binding protein [Nitrogeniibacter mangrovi]|uniref:glutamate/aspartate ABC transporter substrate-binding protein n=1 Tax=Nitrogeniibacter mangrovi TaxID=2016596 RepID=UPI001E3B361D|nr:glutamate/aspartate ABC transporter substrate-binding protein [Nitrogeniibacter mangrovi]
MTRSAVIRIILATLILCLTGAGHPAAAADDDASDTLKTIRERGVIRLGHRLSSIPFSYIDDKGHVMGYSHDLAMHIVEAIRGHLREPDLPVELVPITSGNRIRMVRKGEIDFECGSTTHNTTREREVAFSTTIFIIGTRMLTRRDSGIADFDDLEGRRVVTTAGTTSERLLRQLKEERHIDLTMITARDHGESFLTLETGRADAFMLDDALLYGEVAKSAHPSEWVVTGTPRSFEAYGCMMRKDDPAMKTLVDNTLNALMTSGEAERIYMRWFTRPIPPNNLNLNFPLSGAMRELYRKPNDHPFQ